MLREARLAAGLTQEALAERAGVSVRGIQALERGLSRPQRDTALSLAGALGLDGAVRARFVAVGTPSPRRRAGLPTAVADTSAPTTSPPTNLPLPLTSFVGREHECAAVTDLLARARLLTLTGTGGVGKTRLAIAVAGELVDQYPGGVWLVELAALAEDRLVAQTVLETLGTREEVGRSLLVTLTDHLREKRLLLVLDNCEHLLDAGAALVEALLRRCPGVRVLATSREALGVAGEHRYRVPSLPIPNLAHLGPVVPNHQRPEASTLPPPEQLTEAAVRLFVARAQERRTDFALTAANARAVAQVCARLDGIPLAIELAAARVASLGVEGIAARLDDGFRLLTGGPRTALPRQQTLRATLDWSYDLLAEPERLLLDWLSVFAGGWTLAAAEAVCTGDGVEAWEVLDLLDSLVNKSLVQTQETGGDVRYMLLETVRQYGQERLAAAGRAEHLRNRHLAWCVALAEDAAPHLVGAEQAIYYDRLEREHDNVRAALRWARERGAVEEGLRLAGALGLFWHVCGYQGEGCGWLEGALAGGAGRGAVHARALQWAGHLAIWQGDFRRGADLTEESLALYRALGDRSGIARTLSGLADAMEQQGDYARATLLQEESLALWRALGDRVSIANSLTHLGVVAYRRGEYEHVAALCEEIVSLSREVEDHHGVAFSLTWWACAVERQGAYDRAVAMLEEALAVCQAVGLRMTITWSLVNLGWALLGRGEEERATAYLEESLARSREEGHFWGVPYALTCLGRAAYRRGEHDRAAALLEQALARYRHLGYRWGIAWVLAALGCVLQARGEYTQAAAYLREGLQISRAMGAQGLLSEALEGMAWVAMAEGQGTRAARLGGAAEALREALSVSLHPVLRPGHDRVVAAMREALGEQAFAATWAAGRSLSLDEALALGSGGEG